jgi:hypothetical protein
MEFRSLCTAPYLRLVKKIRFVLQKWWRRRDLFFLSTKSDISFNNGAESTQCLLGEFVTNKIHLIFFWKQFLVL